MPRQTTWGRPSWRRRDLIWRRALAPACRVLVGAELDTQGFPLIRAVGAGSAREPCLLDLRWGRPMPPRVTLVGKGGVFRQWRPGPEAGRRHAG